MACTNCSTEKDNSGTPRGCQSHGSCGTDSCNKLAIFDWLSNMVYPNGSQVFDIVEVRFKNGRKDFYRYGKDLTLSMGDIVATESSPGHDVGIVSLTGELVKVQMKKKKVTNNDDVLKIYRKATQKDIDIWQAATAREEPVRMRARELAIALNLEMKISDVEFQGDASKATFYYTASERVDFRQLIKDFAREFSIRIEMKQVGFRQEAARLGGVGSCGRELCCSTWLTDFRSVNTAAARYQQLSLNPQKLAGQCGKLKCCLNFELDTYLEALKDMPDSDTKLMTVKGLAICQKIDIFKGQMWFAYINNSANWHVLTTEQVKELLKLNKEDKKADELESYALESEDMTPVNVVEEDSLNRFDQPKRRRKPARKRVKEEGSTTAGPRNKPARDARETQPTKPRVAKAGNESKQGAPSDKAEQGSNRNNPKQGPRKPRGPRKDNAPKEGIAKDAVVKDNTKDKVVKRAAKPQSDKDANTQDTSDKPRTNRSRNNKNRRPKNTDKPNDTTNNAPTSNKE